MIRKKQSGFTVIELVIGMSIMTIILGAAVLAQRSTQSTLSSTTTIGLLESKGLRATEIMASELRWADVTSLIITTELGSERLDLQVPADFVGGETVWSTAITYRVEPSNIDADGNGVMDEGRLVRVHDGVTTKLCDYVIAGGFSATMFGDNLQVQINLARRDDTSGQVLTSNVQTSISIRN